MEGSHAATSFDGLVVRELVASLDAMDIRAPNSLQAEALALALAGRSINCVAQTGSGKTLVLLLPLLQSLATTAPPALAPSLMLPEALLLLPSRELLMQHARWLARLAEGTSDRLLLRTIPELLVELQQGTVGLQRVRMVAIDETDCTLLQQSAPWCPALNEPAVQLWDALEDGVEGGVQFILATAYLSAAQEKLLTPMFGWRLARVPAIGGASSQVGVLVPSLEQRCGYY